MDEAGAVEAQAEVEGPVEEGVRVYENVHCHVLRLPDGRYRVVNRKLGIVVGDHGPERKSSAIASADQVAGRPRRLR